MKVFIIEDEQNAARRLVKLIEEEDPDLQVCGIADSIESSLDWIRNNPKPDLIFSDINLGDGLCFDIFREVHLDVPIIFTTAYDEYALKAFDVNSIDYLLKPVKREDLRIALEKLKRWTTRSSGNVPDYQQLASDLSPRHDAGPKRLLIKIGQHIKALNIDEAAYFYTENRIVFVCLPDKIRYPLDLNLDELEKLLDPKKFFRINRQFLISFGSIDSMYAYSKSRVKVVLNPPYSADTIVSVERSPHFKEWLKGV